MDLWLDAVVKKPYIDDYKSLSKNINYYYTPNDQEIIKQDHVFNRFNDTFEGIGNQRYTYKGISNKQIIINLNVNSRRYEADNIFRQLVDSSIKYDLYDETEYLINPKMKQSFYKFLKDNS